MRLAQLLQNKTHFTAYALCRDLSRLSELCLSPDARIEASFAFASESGSNRPLVTMTIHSQLSLKCQRCLANIDWKVSYENQLVAVASEEQAKEISNCYDTVVCEDGYIELEKLVEEEIILALPQTPKHSHNEICDRYIQKYLHNSKADRENPFAVLKNLQGSINQT